MLTKNSLLTPLSGALAGAVLSASTFGLSQAAQAAIIRIDQSAFTPDAGLITFSEFADGTQNPAYTAADYGGAAGAPTITFGGFFAGQGFSANPGVDCPGGAPSGCISGIPTALLSLDPASPATFITGDGSNPTSPVLSGNPLFNGPVSILFDKDVAGIGLDGGFFDAPTSTAIRAFDRNGVLLGEVSNIGTGIEFLGLVTDNGANQIAGLQFSLIGPEPAGFAIDNLRFGTQGQVNPPNKVPEPTTILGTLLAGYGVHRLKKQKKSAAKAV